MPPHAPKELGDTAGASPEKSRKQIDRPNRDLDVTEDVLDGGQTEDNELCEKVAPLHVFQELDDQKMSS